MELTGINYSNKKKGLFRGTYYKKCDISLKEVTKDELKQLSYEIKQIFFNFSYHSEEPILKNDEKIGSHYKSFHREIRFENIKDGLVNIFIKSKRAEELCSQILRIIPKEKLNLEGIATFED